MSGGGMVHIIHRKDFISRLGALRMQVFKGLRRGVQEVAVKKLSHSTSEEAVLRLLAKEIKVLQKV